MAAHHTARDVSSEGSVSVVRQIIDRIVLGISSGAFVKGQLLPPEHDMARELGTSRSSLREAFQVLSYMGVIEIRRGDGTYVTELDGTKLLGGIEMLSTLATGQTALEILEIRRVLESDATRQAAQGITEEQLAGLRTQLEKLDTTETVEDHIDADREYHDMIVAVSGNATLRAMCQSLSLRTFHVWIARGRSDDCMKQVARREHRLIYDYLEAAEPDLAGAAASLHVAGLRDWAKASLTSGADDESMHRLRATQPEIT